ncbi:MAG: family 10 glycosylhydrolase [Phycisphaerales bacterium]
MRVHWLILTCVLTATACLPAAVGDNLVVNGGLERALPENPTLPQAWDQTHHQYEPLIFSPIHYEGKLSGMMVGDGVARMWRQDIHTPPERSWRLSAMVKSESVVLGKDDYIRLYAHVIYKDQPYETATHFSVDVRPGSDDWNRIAVNGAALRDDPIEKIHVSILGKFSGGRVYFDDVSLTSDMTLSDESLLANKIKDLRENLKRVGEVDGSVARCVEWLDKADAALAQDTPDVGSATSHWHSAAKMLSHEAWAAMYPEAMADKPVEAQMLYHGMGIDKAGSDAYLDKIELAGCNAVYLSFGSWMSVNYHSDLLPIEPGWEKFDALTYFVDAAHKRGIKVFGYYAPFYGTSSPRVLPGSIYEKHPEWFAKGPDPNMPTFPDPANPEVVAFILKVYEELASRYEMDGIGLDYIRYPSPSALNYDENNRQKILAECGIDIMAHENLYGDPQAWAKIRAYRHKQVGNIIEQVRATVKRANPDATIMACLISELDMARDDYGQNWAVSSRWIDYASPMNYDDRSLDTDMLADQLAVCRQNNTVYIPAIGGMPELHRKWTISEWADRVAIQRRAGADGIIIYRIGEFDTAVAAFFGKGPFYSAAAFPEPLK